jgi:hypothetical protein
VEKRAGERYGKDKGQLEDAGDSELYKMGRIR